MEIVKKAWFLQWLNMPCWSLPNIDVSHVRSWNCEIVYHIMDLKLLRLTCWFYATGHQIYQRFVTKEMVFASTLIWNHTHKHIQDTQRPIALDTHTNTYWHHPLRVHDSYQYYTEWITCWYKNLLYRGPPVMCMQKLPVLHWLSCWYVNIYFTEVYNVFTFQKLLTCRRHNLLIRFEKTKSFQWNTENTYRNVINEQNTQIFPSFRNALF